MQNLNFLLDDLVKSRHSGEPRIGSGAGSGVQRIYDYLKKLDSGSPLSLGQALPE
jgi:hypothetical protein